jgi:hypothetical protein
MIPDIRKNHDHSKIINHMLLASLSNSKFSFIFVIIRQKTGSIDMMGKRPETFR